MADSVRSFLIKFLGDSSDLKKATGDAEKATGNFDDRMKAVKKSVGDADGATGKLKAGLSELRTQFGGAAGAAAVGTAAVAAVGVVAVKAVNEFKDLGLTIGKFRDATGLSAEAASRFVEVFDDLGIPADKASAAIGKFEKALGANTDAFARYGVEAVKAKDGTIDAEASFVAAIDALSKMQDPAQKAAAAQAMFGRSWQDMAEVISGGAPALRSALDSVQPSKVFSDKDIDASRDVRAAFDSIMDAGQGLMLTLGKSLAPAVTETANVLGEVFAQAEPLVEVIGESLASAFEAIGPIITGVVTAVGPLLRVMAEVSKGVDDLLKGPVGSSGDFAQEMIDAEKKKQAASKEAAVARAQSAEAARQAAQAEDELARASHQASSDAADAADVQRLLAAYTNETERATLAAARAADDQRRALDAARVAGEAKVAAERAAIDSQFAVNDATRSYNAALAELLTKMADGKSSAEDLAVASENVEKAALRQSDAAVRLAEDQANTNGVQLTAAQRAEIQRAKLMELASTMAAGSPLRANLEAYASKLGSLPDDVTTMVQLAGRDAAVNAIGEVQSVMDALNGTTAAVYISAPGLDRVHDRTIGLINALDSLQRKYRQVAL